MVVKDKNQTDQDRFELLLHYCLDFRTLEYLEKYQEEWLAAPCVFDSRLKSSQRAFLSQRLRAVHNDLDSEQDNI
jgi:hypothetical protein